MITVSSQNRYPRLSIILSWYDEADQANWNTSNELKAQYRKASVLTEKRIVFNIHGNSYRLIVAIEYRLKIVFVVWFGTHKQYDKIDAKKVSYVKTIKTKAQYKKVLDRAYVLMQKNIKPGSNDSDELEVLSILIKEYESENFPVPNPNPLEAIRFRLDQMNMSEAGLSKILGYRSRKSEILSGKRKLNLTMIRRLAENLNIPADVLIQEY